MIKNVYLLLLFLFPLIAVYADDRSCDEEEPIPLVPTSIYERWGVCTTKMIIEGAYTLWTAREPNWTTSVGAISEGSRPPPEHGVTYAKWKLRSGFKFAMGAIPGHDGWKFLLEFTWFYNKGNRLKGFFYHDDLQKYSWLPIENSLAVREVQGEWSNAQVRLDASLARPFMAGRCMHFSPFLGFMGWHGGQHLSTTFVKENTEFFGETKTLQIAWGLGPYGGTATSFLIFKSCDDIYSIFFDWSMATPWSHFSGRVRTFAGIAGVVENFVPNRQHSKDTLWFTTIVYTTTLGLRWEHFPDDTWAFIMQAGWESQTWWDQNHAYNLFAYVQGLGDSTYIMQGLTFKVAFIF